MEYCKVAISNTSGLEAHAGLFRLLTYSRLRNRLRAGNKHRAWKIWQKFEVFVMKNCENIFFLIFDNELINLGFHYKTLGPEINKRLAYISSGV